MDTIPIQTRSRLRTPNQLGTFCYVLVRKHLGAARGQHQPDRLSGTHRPRRLARRRVRVLSAARASRRAMRWRCAPTAGEARSLKRDTTSLLCASLAVEAPADDELARGSQDAERAPRHAQLAVVGVRDSLDLKLAVDYAHLPVELERDVRAGGVQLPTHLEGVAFEDGGVREKADLGVLLDVEEVRRTQVLIALGVLRVKAGRVDGQRHRRLRAQVEDPLVALKVPLDGH